MAEEPGIGFPGFPVRLLADAGQCAKNDLFANAKWLGQDHITGD